MIRCRVYWRDEVDGVEELAREPAMLPETWRHGKGQKVRYGTSHYLLFLYLQLSILNIAVGSLIPRATRNRKQKMHLHSCTLRLSNI